jgi:hemerythrin-like domain-containing protein
MARIPKGDRAVVDMLKLTGYVLNSEHRTGRHKARVFAAALGLTANDADVLAAALRRAAEFDDAALEREDHYGVHYSIESDILFNGIRRRIRSLWTVRSGEECPRFVTAFVMAEDDGDE